MDPVHLPAVYILPVPGAANAQAFPPRPLLSFAACIASPLSCART